MSSPQWPSPQTTEDSKEGEGGDDNGDNSDRNTVGVCSHF